MALNELTIDHHWQSRPGRSGLPSRLNPSQPLVAYECYIEHAEAVMAMNGLSIDHHWPSKPARIAFLPGLVNHSLQSPVSAISGTRRQ